MNERQTSLKAQRSMSQLRDMEQYEHFDMQGYR